MSRLKVKPLFNRDPIELIVHPVRLEQYRGETDEWLAERNIALNIRGDGFVSAFKQLGLVQRCIHHEHWWYVDVSPISLTSSRTPDELDLIENVQNELDSGTDPDDVESSLVKFTAELAMANSRLLVRGPSRAMTGMARLVSLVTPGADIFATPSEASYHYANYQTTDSADILAEYYQTLIEEEVAPVRDEAIRLRWAEQAFELGRFGKEEHAVDFALNVLTDDEVFNFDLSGDIDNDFLSGSSLEDELLGDPASKYLG